MARVEVITRIMEQEIADGPDPEPRQVLDPAWADARQEPDVGIEP